MPNSNIPVITIDGPTASGLLGTMYIVQFVAVVIAINLALRASPAFAYRLAALSFGAGVVVLIGLWSGGVTAGRVGGSVGG